MVDWTVNNIIILLAVKAVITLKAITLGLVGNTNIANTDL